MIGASMAGLVTAAAFVEHRQVFGRAAFISPQWPLYDRHMIEYPQLLAAWPDYFAAVGRPAGRRLWLEHGTTMIDAGMGQHQQAIVRRLEAMGWRRGTDFEARAYEGGAHTWPEWAAHMDDILTFLLG